MKTNQLSLMDRRRVRSILEHVNSQFVSGRISAVGFTDSKVGYCFRENNGEHDKLEYKLIVKDDKMYIAFIDQVVFLGDVKQGEHNG